MTTKPPRQEDSVTRLDDALTQLENHRTEGLTNARQSQEIKHSALEKEQIRLSQKYGEGHPRVQKIAARLSYDRNLFDGLDQEISRSKNRIPPLPENGWRVQGQVFDKDGAPLAKQSVYLSDKRNQAIEQLEYACSDEGGYYAIALSEKQIDTLPSRKLYLSASDANRTVIHRSTQPVTTAKGEIELKNIYVGENSCSPPFEKDTPDADVEYAVEGIVSDNNKRPLPNLTVRAFVQDLKNQHPLGKEAVTNVDGYYRISYQLVDFNLIGMEVTDADIIVYVYDQNGTELLKSKVFRSSKQVSTIDLTIVLRANS